MASTTRLQRAVALTLTAVALVACGDATSPNADGSADTAMQSTPDASDAGVDAAVDVPQDVPFVTAMHAPLPQVPNHGGPVMHNVRIVTVTYADDTSRTELEGFDAWIGTSAWLTTVGADYGVGAGTVLGNVELTTSAPTTITSTQIEANIAAGITAGTYPSPPDGDFSNVLYMVYFPQTTTINLIEPGAPPGSAQQSCMSFGGYHSEVHMGTIHVSYAAVPDCGGGFGGSDAASEELAASHEYIEAATDPLPFSHPGYVLPVDGTTAWAFIGGEIGDLCELSHSVYQTPDGHVVQRIWSNSAAAAGLDPCIPANPAQPYFNVSVDPGDVQFVNAGDTVTFTLSGWSVQPMAPWGVQVVQEGGSINVNASLSSSQLSNGGTTTLTLTIPASAQSQDYATFLISSSETTPRDHQVWPIAIVVN